MTRIAVAFVAALLAFASGAGHATAQQPPAQQPPAPHPTATAPQPVIQSQMVGTWRTVSVVQERTPTSKVDLYHGRINGMAVFTGDGHFMQTITEHDTPRIATGNRQTLSPEEALTIERQSYAVFGTYTVNEPTKTCTLRVIGSTFPNEVGSEQALRIGFAGDEMTVTNPKPASGGKAVIVTLRRVN
jgi:Lipocalin-like domain